MKAKAGVPHRLARGKFIDHSAGCHCPLFLFRGDHVRWDTEVGQAWCFHCGEKEELPLPCVRENFWSNRVYPDYDALADDLNRFFQTHDGCLKPETPRGPGLVFDPIEYLRGSSRVRIKP